MVGWHSRWIKNASWPESKVCVDLTRETIQNGPEWNNTIPVTREYEDKLHEYYAPAALLGAGPSPGFVRFSEPISR
jgi:hypothetical protein